MTELLSQAYSLGNGVFECPLWMDVLIRDTEDALQYVANGKTGGINQGGHIGGPLLEMTEQLQPGRLTQKPKKLAVLLK